MIGDLTFECLDCKQPLFPCSDCGELFHARELRFHGDGSEVCFACFDKPAAPTRGKIITMPRRANLARILAAGVRP